MNIRLELKDLFTHTLLKAQARVIDQTRKTAFLAIAPAPVQPAYPLSSSQRRLWMLSQIGQEAWPTISPALLYLKAFSISQPLVMHSIPSFSGMKSLEHCSGRMSRVIPTR